MTETEQETSINKQWRFYRSNLATKVWDAVNNRLMADFSEGTFITDDPEVAKRLISDGYPQVALDAETPPDILVSQPTMVIDGDVPIVGKGVSEKLAEATIQGKMKPVGGPQAPKVVKRVK